MWVEWTIEEVSLPLSCVWKVIGKFAWALCLKHRSLSFWKMSFCSRGRSPWSPFVTTIFFVVRGEVGNGGRSPSPFSVQLSLQMINLLLHGFGILFMREVTTTPRMALTSVGSMHTSLSVPSLFKVNKMILPLGPLRFYPLWTWTCHNWKSNSLSLQDFP